MAFVKLDCQMLNSSLWVDREAREIFLTALLMAEPYELQTAAPQLAIRNLGPLGWSVPPGWYGFVPAAGIGIVGRAGLERESGLNALERLGEPDPESRSHDFDGRRLVRVDGGFVVLNFYKYRERDYTSAARSDRYRKNKRERQNCTESRRDNSVSRRDDTEQSRESVSVTRDITQAEAEAEAEAEDREKHSAVLSVPVERIEGARLSQIQEIRTIFKSPGLPAMQAKLDDVERQGLSVEDLIADLKTNGRALDFYDAVEKWRKAKTPHPPARGQTPSILDQKFREAMGE